MALRDFFEKTTKIFEIEVKFNGEYPDLRTDTVTFVLKKRKDDADEDAVLTKEADTFTEGEQGKAIFELTPTDTAVDPRAYYYEIKWETGEHVYILESDDLTVLDRIFD